MLSLHREYLLLGGRDRVVGASSLSITSTRDYDRNYNIDDKLKAAQEELEKLEHVNTWKTTTQDLGSRPNFEKYFITENNIYKNKELMPNTRKLPKDWKKPKNWKPPVDEFDPLRNYDKKYGGRR